MDKVGEITSPGIGRTSVWDATNARIQSDFLYHCYAIGYFIAWRNPTLRLLARCEIGIAIGNKAAATYFGDLAKQFDGWKNKYLEITSDSDMKTNLRMNCLHEAALDSKNPCYGDLLRTRRRLMAREIKAYFGIL